MKKFIFLLFTLTSSLLSFAQGSITYELNGGITNDFGWQNKQDMYETLNADWNAYSGTSTTWKTLVELNGDVAAGIPNQAGAMNLTFLENEGFKLHFSWLITYMDATCTTQGVTLCSSSASYLRYNLAAFFLNTQRTSWPKTADYTLAGDVKYFQPTWKGGFCGPTEYAKDEVVTLPIPYKEGKTFAGWYKKADFSGDKITVISGSGDITLYAKWVEYIPNIAEVIAMVDGTTTTVQGIVTYVEGDNFWIQDDTGGLFCYGKENNVKEGELVTISGNKATYYGSAKLENAIVIEQTNTNILEPQTLLLSTINTNKTDYLNELIYLEGVTISRFESENKTLYLTDGLNEIALYNWDGITEDKFPVGSKVSVKAVLSIHDTTLQLRGKEAWLVTATAVGKDNYEYPEVETDGYKFNLTNNWLYSVNLNNWSENRPNPLAEGSRSVVEKDGILYFSYRDNNNPIEQPRLVRIDAQTGKMLNPIFFADYIFKDVNGNWLFGPYTDLKLDNAGNAITSNLPISGGAFQIWNVDLETGEGRLIVDLATDPTKWLSAQFPENTTIRLDRIGVYGDINGDATIMSVVSSGADVYYWTIKDGKWDGETNWIKLGLGEGVNVGGAPVICPIEGDYFYVDGFTTHPLLFDPDGNLVDAFDEAHEANHLMLGTKGVQRGKSHNGVTEFEVNGEYYLLCAGDNTNGNATAPSTFVLYKFADEYRAFKDITPLYEFPMAGMGGATNPQRVATSFARPNKEGTSIDIYVFTAENGYGKYTLSLEKINDIIASGTCGDNLTWQLTKDGVLTISGTGKMYDYNYNLSDQPWNSYKQQIKTININDGVTSIGNYAFYDCSSLTSISIPNSVTSIGNSAFEYCSSLTSITIPNSVTSIGYRVFANCTSLTSITIPNSVTSIGNNAFRDCYNLTSITIPNSVTSIGNYAFEHCSSLTSITIPNSVTSIGNQIFTNCSSLTSIEVNADNLNYTSIGGVLYNKDVTTLICCPGGKTSITIPNSVTSIGDYAFYGCKSLKSITIPNSVTSIGNYAFSYCSSLTSITIPNSVTSIGDYAFYYCSGLTSINIEATIPPTIGGANTFNKVSKNIPVTVPCGSLSAYQSANYWSEFTNYVEEFPYTFSATTADATMGRVTIETAPACGVDAVIKATPNDDYRFVKWSDGNTDNPRTITVAEDITLTAEFANNIIASGTCGDNLTWKLTFDSVLTISGTGAMYDYNLSSQPWNSYKQQIKTININDGVTSIGERAFSDCSSLTSITIPNSVTSIGEWAFRVCSSLTSITIPNSVTSIGNGAFSNCYSLTSITIPNSVTSIGEWAFFYCYALTSITIPNSVTSIGNYAFSSCDALTSITIPNSVTSIGISAFSNCSSLTSIAIPNSVTSIGGSAFYECSSLASITIPNSVTSIGNAAFEYCSSLASITIPNRVTSIGEWAFSWCSSLISITIPNSVTSIGSDAFSDCSSLTSISIPNSVTSIGNNAFRDCSSLTSITIGNSVTSIGNAAFYGCSRLTSITIPNSVTSIGDAAFYECSSLTSITIPNSVTSIVDYAFYNCTGLTSINIEATIPPTIGGASTFVNVSKNIPVTVPCGSLSAYQSAEYWSEFTNFVEEFPYTFSATTADATMGSVTIETAPACGVDAVIKATPNAGYRFVKWSDGNTNATRSIVVNEDMTLSAIFEKIPTFTINVTANAQMGSATGGGTFETGKSITLSAIANEGYRFVKWSDGITTNPRTITVTQNISLEAIFEVLYVNWYPDNNDEHSFLGKHYYDTVTITAGKTLIIEDKATIACNDIVIKADKNGNVPDIKVVGDIIANNGVTYEWEIDDTRWYFFSLPFNCKIQDIKLSTIANGPKDGVWNYYNPNDGSGDFIIRKYNQKNASNGQGKKTGWEDCKGNEMLHKGRGYIIGLFPSGSKAKAMFKSEKQELLSKLIEQELDFGDDHSWFDYQAGDNALYNGWNLVGIPYFEAFSQGELDAAYVSIPNSDGVTYKQYTLNEALNKGLLRPFMSFFIQLGENRAPIFSPNDRSNAPRLREKENNVNNKIIVDIRYVENEELSDKTTIINNVALTAEYEIGHDLQKMIGYAEQPQIYTIEECGILAFNAQDVSSRMSIRLGVYAPVDGEYVIGGEAWGDMADVMLYDNETYRSTSLIIPQTIYLEKGVHDERFEIRVQSSSIPTGVDNEMRDLEVMIEEGRLYVENVPANAVLYIYDMNGKLVHQQRTDTAIDYEFYAQGIYNITIYTDNNKVFNTKIVY